MNKPKSKKRRDINTLADPLMSYNVIRLNENV